MIGIGDLVLVLPLVLAAPNASTASLAGLPTRQGRPRRDRGSRATTARGVRVGRPPRVEGDAVAIETLQAIQTLQEQNGGVAPSRRELAAKLDRSIAAVLERLDVLKRRGFVSYEIGCMRSLAVTAAGAAFLAGERFE